MFYPRIQLTVSAESENDDKVETWLFTYEEDQVEKSGYITLNFSNPSTGCKTSVCGTDGLPIEGLGLDETLMEVRLSDFVTVPFAEYVEMTKALTSHAMDAGSELEQKEPYCLPQPDFSRFAKELFSVRN
ncbi:hypothetical protein MLD52_01930 [Puniceicoccaceae bacterium K14]|nr:hypothetical protein [Puniceicoccaceae bacterium K14]